MFVLAPWYRFVMSATMGRTRDAAPSVEGLESLRLTTTILHYTILHYYMYVEKVLKYFVFVMSPCGAAHTGRGEDRMGEPGNREMN